MKSLLRFVLLFALIVIGKLTKQSATARDTAKLLHRNSSLLMPATSFFTRQVSLPIAPVGSEQFWHTTNKAEQQVQFE
ncbi:hypothetical protein [Hymenobacter crusticola]|uniref:hypothetical protein n=1 Tax=Hymenobacter crusticola TaxID=1770526 RepID=UPI00117BB247|nr:hypothetical protein [Hymenobacter crusticola]